MHIKRLTLRNFRNYEDAELEFSPLTNMIYGENAQGKTNILEAVYLFAQGRSHRAKTDKELVRFGEDFARVAIEFADAKRDYTGKLRIMRNGRKAVSINHVHITKLSRLMSYLNVVMFSPEDLSLVKGAPPARRRFIDSSLSQLYPAYMAALAEYNKALGQKNSLLRIMRMRGQTADPTLSVWNDSLAETGARIMAARTEFTDRISETAAALQREISGETLKIVYKPSLKLKEIGKDEIYNCLEERSAREAEQGAAQYGIQRDDMDIYIGGREAKLFGSQGQQRTAALCMKIAQSEYIRDVKGEYPVLLLDDIMSELDITRRRYLAEHIKDKQVLITSTDTDIRESTETTGLFHISGGRLI